MRRAAADGVQREKYDECVDGFDHTHEGSRLCLNRVAWRVLSTLTHSVCCYQCYSCVSFEGSSQGVTILCWPPPKLTWAVLSFRAARSGLPPQASAVLQQAKVPANVHALLCNILHAGAATLETALQVPCMCTPHTGVAISPTPNPRW